MGMSERENGMREYINPNEIDNSKKGPKTAHRIPPFKISGVVWFNGTECILSGQMNEFSSNRTNNKRVNISEWALALFWHSITYGIPFWGAENSIIKNMIAKCWIHSALSGYKPQRIVESSHWEWCRMATRKTINVPNRNICWMDRNDEKKTRHQKSEISHVIRPIHFVSP